jgi:hypothetical protein
MGAKGHKRSSQKSILEDTLMKPKIKHYRQGDVLISQIEALPKGSQTKRESGVVAYGEATGHAHCVCVEEGAEVLEIAGGLFVRVTSEEGVSIVHAEHRALRLPRGDYRVTIQREYTPKEIQDVRD